MIFTFMICKRLPQKGMLEFFVQKKKKVKYQKKEKRPLHDDENERERDNKHYICVDQNTCPGCISPQNIYIFLKKVLFCIKKIQLFFFFLGSLRFLFSFPFRFSLPYSLWSFIFEIILIDNYITLASCHSNTLFFCIT